jgi:serine/threonine-protein kinase
VADSPKTDLSGAKIGEYEIIARIGVGGMGEVYEGRQPLIGKRVAVKVLLASLSNEKELVERFLAEARAVNEIRHRGIVDIFSFGQLPNGSAYFVMEFLDGQAFDRILKARGALPIAEALSYVEEVLDALESAHAAGIVHRDIKPSNIFLVNTGRGKPYVKLLDFGIAKLGKIANGSDSSPQTRASVILGTPDYISPEQARGKPISAATDLYALGAVLFEMVTGFRPFRGENTLQTMWMHVEDQPPVPSTIRADVPPALDELILWALEKESHNRPSSAEEMRAHLQAVRASLLPGSGSTTPAPITGRNSAVVMAATPSGRQKPLAGTPPPRLSANSGSLPPIDVTAPRPVHTPADSQPTRASGVGQETRVAPSLTANGAIEVEDRTRVEVRPELTTDPERQAPRVPERTATSEHQRAEEAEAVAPSRGPLLAVVGIVSVLLIGVGSWVLFGDSSQSDVPKPPVDTAKPLEPAKPTEATKPVETAKPTEPAKPVETATPTEATKPTETAKPVEPAKPTEAAKPTETAKPVEPAKPVQIAKPTETAKPVQTAKPVEPKPTAKGITKQQLEARLSRVEAKLQKKEAEMGEPDLMMRKFLGAAQAEVNAASDDGSRKAALRTLDDLERQLR